MLMVLFFKISVSVSTLCQIHSKRERLSLGAVTSDFVLNSNGKTNYF